MIGFRKTLPLFTAGLMFFISIPAAAGDMAFPKNFPDQVQYLFAILVFTSPFWIPIYAILWTLTYVARSHEKAKVRKITATISAFVSLLVIGMLMAVGGSIWVILGVIALHGIISIITFNKEATTSSPPVSDAEDQPQSIPHTDIKPPFKVGQSPIFSRNTWVIGFAIIIVLIILMVVLGTR